MVLPHDEHTLVILYGDIDQRISQDLEEAGRFRRHPARKNIIDVRKMTMMDSAGLSFIIRLGAGLQAAGTHLRLQGPSRRTAELITLVGADSLMTWLPDQTKPDLSQLGRSAQLTVFPRPHLPSSRADEWAGHRVRSPQAVRMGRSRGAAPRSQHGRASAGSSTAAKACFHSFTRGQGVAGRCSWCVAHVRTLRRVGGHGFCRWSLV
ncbi:hypothetical protein GCM10022223_41860 [Kineosporia mesophila]|uniref:STAS domain-containing protein n=1 Tax=Kineosporia mesophila TaxID=566012 RepID=A0ABP6ZYZ6_9ACTN|nr:STAS domain-containing protein [Kineosporia mesophila]MCD5355234.1 STAS domain-containing protein [Kineosporia mesophila]